MRAPSTWHRYAGPALNRLFPLLILHLLSAGELLGQQGLRPLRPGHWAYELVESLEALGVEAVWTPWHGPVLGSSIHEAIARARAAPSGIGHQALLDRWEPLLEREIGARGARTGQINLGLGLDRDGTFFDEEEGAIWSGSMALEVGSRTALWAEAAGSEAGPDLELASGGASVRLGPIAIVGGRVPVSSGQGRDKMLLSGRSARNGLFVGTNGPARLPEPFGWLGRIAGHFFLATGVETPDVPDAWFGSMGFDFSPHPRVRLGVARTAHIGGEGLGTPTFGDVARALYWGGENSDIDDGQGEVSLRIRWGPAGRSLTTYASLGLEDTKSFLEDPGVVAGGLVPVLFDGGLITFRYEYSAFGKRARWCRWCDYRPHLWYGGRLFGPYVHQGLPIGSELGGYGSSHWAGARFWSSRVPVQGEISLFRRNREVRNLYFNTWPGVRTGARLDLSVHPRSWLEVRAGASWARHESADVTGFEISLRLCDLLGGA